MDENIKKSTTKMDYWNENYVIEVEVDKEEKKWLISYAQRIKKNESEAVKEAIRYMASHPELPILNYNKESDLAALVNLIYLSARNTYRIEREDRAGKGFVDMIFYPQKPTDDCIILELKVDATTQEAIAQIKDKQYALRLRGTLGNPSQYTGRILAVGMSYDKKTKLHRCEVEVLSS